MKNLSILFFLCLSTFSVNAQMKNYWVYFKNKPNDNKELSAPVNAKYLSKISTLNIQVIGSSKWFNAAYISTDKPQALRKLQKLSFVKKIEAGRRYKVQKSEITGDTFNYGQADVQINMLGLQNYHSLGYTGKGVKLALFDGGFFKVDSNIAFDSLRKRNGILATRDFVNNNNSVYEDNEHGMYVLSLIAGYVKDSLLGAAPDVSLLLARTEDVATEKHIEEFNWVRAVEWADSNGVDIIHSSLGYSLFDSLQGSYTYNDMDGESTVITQAAQMAFKRGIFICNSAGNEGKKTWKYITAPCDGKDVLCVGAVDSFRRKADFSSFGPSADGRVKPDVMAMGSNVTIIGTNNIIRRGGGTSFSGPLIAGFVACLKQAFPNIDNKILLEAIRKSGDQYLNPTDSMGYGIPDIHRADSLIRKALAIKKLTTKSFIKVYPNPCSTSVKMESDFDIRKCEISDISGSLYETKFEQNQVDLSSLKPGIYFLRIYKDGSIYSVVKLVKI